MSDEVPRIRQLRPTPTPRAIRMVGRSGSVPSGYNGFEVRVTGTKEVAARIQQMEDRVERSIDERAIERGRLVVAHLREALLGAYTADTATGRYARGIRFTTRKVPNGRSVVIYALNYREGRFLTSLGGGFFHAKPYTIHAKPGKTLIVPRFGYVSYRPDRKKQKEKLAYVIGTYRRISEMGGPKVPVPVGSSEFQPLDEPSDDPRSQFFYYPLQVRHPGFGAYGDIPMMVIREEVDKYTSGVTKTVQLQLP